jgi:hypothetical protein
MYVVWRDDDDWLTALAQFVSAGSRRLPVAPALHHISPAPHIFSCCRTYSAALSSRGGSPRRSSRALPTWPCHCCHRSDRNRKANGEMHPTEHSSAVHKNTIQIACAVKCTSEMPSTFLMHGRSSFGSCTLSFLYSLYTTLPASCCCLCKMVNMHVGFGPPALETEERMQYADLHL